MCNTSETAAPSDLKRSLARRWALLGWIGLTVGLASCAGSVTGTGPGAAVPTPTPLASNEPSPRPQGLQTVYEVSLSLAKGVSALGTVGGGFVRTSDSGGLWQADTPQVQALATQSFVPPGFPFVYGGSGRWLMEIDNGVGRVHVTMTLHRMDGSVITVDAFDSGNYMPLFDPVTGMPIGSGPLSDLLNGTQPDYSQMRMRLVDRFEPFLGAGGVQVEIGVATSDLFPLPVDPVEAQGPMSLTYHVGAATLSLPTGGLVTMSHGSYTVTEIRDLGAVDGVHDFGNAVVDGSFDYRLIRSDGTWTGHARHNKFGPVAFTVFKDDQLVGIATQSLGALVLVTSDGQEIGALSGM